MTSLPGNDSLSGQRDRISAAHGRVATLIHRALTDLIGIVFGFGNPPDRSIVLAESGTI